jgi:hypothetical protein
MRTVLIDFLLEGDLPQLQGSFVQHESTAPRVHHCTDEG